jgi:hypothetical protein
MHSAYKVDRKNRRNDMVAIKEASLNTETNEITKTLRFFFNPERTFYITKEKYRNHVESKEDEDIRKLQVYKCTQATMADKASKVLKVKAKGIRAVSSSPYIYGADVHVSSVIMDKYRTKFGSTAIMPEVAIMDYEWDIKPGGNAGSASIGTFGFNNDIHLTIREDKISNCGMTKEQYVKRMFAGFDEHVLPIVNDYYENGKGKGQVRREFKLHIDIVRLDIDVIKKLFTYTHIYKPDFLAFWNGISDLTVIEEHCERRHVAMSEFMCDESVPAAFAYTDINKGEQGFKLDAKGNKKKIDYFNEWHTLDNIAHWQYIDMMHIYATNRDHLPNLPSYGMDAILTADIGLGKLKLVPEVDTKDMGAWHTTMSNKHIVEYSLYATFDVIGPILLEDKQHEVGGQFFPRLNLNPLDTYKKNPRQLATKMHFELIDKGRVVGSSGSAKVNEFNNAIWDGDRWIITLNTHYHAEIGGYALEDSQTYTLWIPMGGDSDLTSSYPMNQRMVNGSRATTVTEMCWAENIPDVEMRMFGLNFSAGEQNFVMMATDTLGLPNLNALLEGYPG